MTIASALSPSAHAIFHRAATRSPDWPIAGQARGGTGPYAERSQLDFSLIDSMDGLSGLADAWSDLFARHGRPGQVFQTHAWCAAWAKSFLSDQRNARQYRLFVVTGRRAGRLVFVWPLMEERGAGSTRLVWLGTPVTQYGDVVMDPAAGEPSDVLADAWAFVRASTRADYVHLAKVRADAVIAPFLASCGAVATVRERAPYLDFSTADGYAQYAAGKYSKKARKNRARNERKLAELGELKIERLEAGPQAQEAVRQAFAHKRAWLRKTGRVSRAIDDPATEAFFVALADCTAARRAGTAISTLHIGRELAACEIAFVCKGHQAVHVLVYAEAFERFSPGKVLVENSIEACFAHDVTRYDLMAPADDYKVAIADGSVEVVDWAIPASLKGQAWVRAYLGFVRPGLKRLQAAMPVSTRRGVAAIVARLRG